MLLPILVLTAAVALGVTSSPSALPASATASAPLAELPTYPYKTASRVGPWGFYTRHATDYVAWRFFEREVAFSSRMQGANGRTGLFADPGTWAANAVHIGFTVDASPKPGSIAHWNGGEQGAGGGGHVAYVERVNADGSVVISELDWSVKHGYSERGHEGTPPVRAPRYIHIRDE